MRRSSLVAALVLVAGSLHAQDTPAPVDLTLTLQDHNYKLTAPIPAGKSTWLVRNAGTERHQALVVKLPQGISEYTERNWIANGKRGDEPAVRVASVELDPGKDTQLQVDLAPGRYLILCTMSEDEGFHFDLGMVYRFTIE